MRRAVSTLLLACAALGASPARAVLCTPDPVPAATLLLPYFEVDTRDLSAKKPKRATPVITLLNLNAASLLARVTLWTDLSVPTLAFDVQMTGYDVAEVDLWAVFRGELPGALAQLCNGTEPIRELTEEQRESLRLAHAGQPVPANGGLCSGLDHGDTLLRGYVTVDNVVNICSPTAIFPSDPGYFGPDGLASDENVLAGQYFVQSRKRKIFETGRLVAIEAETGQFGAGDATFYGRYVGYTGVDAREPLPATWAVRTLSDPAAKRSTELLVWRNAEAVQGPFACESRGQAGWFPLAAGDLVAFDDEENAFDLGEAAPFPAEAGRVRIGSEALPASAPSGWLYLNLANEQGQLQSFVTARVQQGAKSARGLVDATPFEAGTCPAAPTPGTPIP